MNINNQLDLENYDIWYVPFWKTNLFYITIVFLIFTILIISIFIVKKYFSKKEVSVPQQCFQKLNNLEKDLNNPKEFYGKLFFILKKYFSFYFNINLNFCTEIELIEFLKNQLALNEFEKLSGIIERAQIVKFTTLPAKQDHIKEDLTEVKELINFFENQKNQAKP